MRKTRIKRSGFTLVELLVVIAIIAMLASMLLPAVQGARAAARKTQCINNHHTIGIAMIRFEGEKNRYPGYSNNQNPTNGFGGAICSWVFSLLPYLDRSDIYNNYGPSGVDAGLPPTQHLKIMVCPDDAESINNSTNLTYVVNCGLRGDPVAESSAVGVFTYQYKAAVNSVVTAMNTGAITDGLATTLMIGENIDATQWVVPSEESVGFTWEQTAPTPPSQWMMNSQAGTGATTGMGTMPRPSSFHAGGVVFTFCDGHTQFISEDISYSVYQMLMTPRGRSCPTPQGILPENAY